ncbi:hypothetical protein ATG66_0521 [Vibrio sp. ES.051]|uniref:hypothetical protein n=1 Tax=Vibrio sp. ES.051 TaxID=1761909 RepID=UPI000BF6C371|nr:hypothetical protein [Vibrio sp. ES.051]PFG58017.1 hypothetical protein ATG66_0521 [Vibrio sp. ES.051]
MHSENTPCIQEFIEQLFQYEKEANSAIAKKVLFFLHEFCQEYPRTRTLITPLILECTKQVKPGNYDLNFVYRLLKGRQILGENYFSAMIVCPMNPYLISDSDKQKIERYEVLCLVALIASFSVENCITFRQKIPHIIRMIKLGKRTELLQILPDLHGKNYREIVTVLRRFVLEGKRKNFAQSRIDESELLVRAAEIISNHLPVLTTRKVSKFPKTPYFDSTIERPFYGDASFGHLEVTQLYHFDASTDDEVAADEQYESDNLCIEEDQFAISTSKSSSIVYNPHAIHNDYSVESARAALVNSSMLRNAQLHNSSIATATSHEVRRFITHYFMDDMKSDASDRLMLSLLTGRSIGALMGEDWVINEEGYITGFMRHHQLPSTKYALNSITVTHADRTIETFELSIPPIVRYRSSLFHSAKEENEEVLYLNALNKETNSRLTPNKVSRFFCQYGKSVAVDPVIEGVIRGVSLSTLPASYYTKFKLRTVQQHYHHYFQFLSIISEITLLMAESSVSDECYLGTMVPYDKTQLKFEIKLLSKTLIQCISLETNESLHEMIHNLLVLFLIKVLSIASGYRPVHGWFGSLTDLNLSSGYCCISDKERLETDSSRVIKLPSTALNLINDYLRFCEQSLRNRFTPEIPATRYEQTLNGKNHLFFFINGNKTLEPSPKNWYRVSLSMPIPIPAQANWGRHQTRSFLIERGIHPDIIAAWMGHHQGGNMAFEHYSSLSLADLTTVADTLDQLLISLGVVRLYD